MHSLGENHMRGFTILQELFFIQLSTLEILHYEDFR